MRKPLYIEFNGVAGCGKTTICQELYKSLTKQGLSVSQYQNLYNKFTSNKHWRHKIRCMIFSFDGIRVLWNSIPIIFACIKKGKREFVHYFILSKLLLAFFLKQDKSRLMLSDEGVFQYIVSLFFDIPINGFNLEKVVLNEINCLKRNSMVLIVNLNVDKYTNISRINTRENGQSRLDSKTQDELESIIAIQTSNFKRVREVIPSENSMTLNSSRSIQSNVVELLSEITKRINDND